MGDRRNQKEQDNNVSSTEQQHITHSRNRNLTDAQTGAGQQGEPQSLLRNDGASAPDYAAVRPESSRLEELPRDGEGVAQFRYEERYWIGQLPNPEDFKNYPDWVQHSIVNMALEPITAEISRQQSLTRATVVQAYAITIGSVLVTLAFIAAAIVLFAKGNNAGGISASTLSALSLIAAVIQRYFEHNKKQDGEDKSGKPRVTGQQP